MCYEINIKPRDIMFFRDGKPIGSSAEGSGVYWPMPNIVHSAIKSAINNHFGTEPTQWESKHSNREGENNTNHVFGGLKTWGPFIKDQNGTIFLPTPSDLQPEEEEGDESEIVITNGVSTPTKITNSDSNLPEPLKYCVAATTKPSKRTLGEWISTAEYEKYLKGETVGLKTVKSSSLYSSEARPGIGINPETQNSSEARPGIGINPETQTTEVGKFFSAEYLRLNKGVSMVSFADCKAKKHQSSEEKDILEQFFLDQKNPAIIIGGQRSVARIDAVRTKNAGTINMEVNQEDSTHIKWALITPAYFMKGWIPGWINMPHNDSKSYDPNKDDGCVMLKEKIDRGQMSRKEWRKKIEDSAFIKANLVAAKLGKPTVVSGWKIDISSTEAGGVPKATKLFVPAGTVYYFECENIEEANKLKTILNGQTKSDLLGEKGFGLGICSNWKLNTL